MAKKTKKLPQRFVVRPTTISACGLGIYDEVEANHDLLAIRLVAVRDTVKEVQSLCGALNRGAATIDAEGKVITQPAKPYPERKDVEIRTVALKWLRELLIHTLNESDWDECLDDVAEKLWPSEYGSDDYEMDEKTTEQLMRVVEAASKDLERQIESDKAK